MAAPTRSQDQPNDDDPAAVLQRFTALDVRRKATVIRLLQRNLSGSEDQAIQRIGALRLEFDELPAAPTSTPTYGDPRTDPSPPYRAAQGRIERRAVATDSAAYRKVAERFARPAWLPDLKREVDYDWAEHRIVRLEPLGYDDLFANALAGYPPGSDHALAAVLAALDSEPAEHARGSFFAHTYCDLDGHSYPGITLYDAWYSGRVVDVPDVDAVPFGWLVLGEKNHASPLQGKPRDRLYERIKEAAMAFRIHRTTCEAAAAAFVAAEPQMDPMYALLVPRFHWLFATMNDDFARVAQRIHDEGRDQLLQSVDAAIKDRDGSAFAVRQARKVEMTAMADRVRASARAALARAGTN